MNLNNVVSLSHYLSSSTQGYGGAQSFKVREVSSIAEGKSSNSQEWTLSNHIGTHIDLPAHFDSQGKRLHEFDDNFWIFKAPHLIHLPSQADEIISLSNIFESIPDQADFLIIKTDFQRFRSHKEYWNNNPGLSPDLADYLRKNKKSLRGVGFDFISLTAYQNRELGRKAHRHFLESSREGSSLCIIEDMNLEKLKTSPKALCVAPLWVEGADGSPVSVFAFL